MGFLLGADAQSAAQVPPVGSEYNDRATDGSYRFGFQTGDQGGHYHAAIASKDNQVAGRFGSRDPSNGNLVETQYTSGQRGFRARGPNIHRKMDLSQNKIPYNPPVDPNSPNYNPTLEGYHDPNEDPSYSFGFRTPTYQRKEVADPGGHVNGEYSFVDDVGERHDVAYEAGAKLGFNVKTPFPDSKPFSGLFYRGPPSKPGGKTSRGKTSIQQRLDGSYRFVSSGPDQRRTEVSDSAGNVRGSYSYIDDKGQQRTVQYIAGPNIGYRIINKGIGIKFPPAAPFVPPTGNYPSFPPDLDVLEPTFTGGGSSIPSKDDLFGGSSSGGGGSGGGGGGSAGNFGGSGSTGNYGGNTGGTGSFGGGSTTSGGSGYPGSSTFPGSSNFPGSSGFPGSTTFPGSSSFPGGGGGSSTTLGPGDFGSSFGDGDDGFSSGGGNELGGSSGYPSSQTPTSSPFPPTSVSGTTFGTSSKPAIWTPTGSTTTSTTPGPFLGYPSGKPPAGAPQFPTSGPFPGDRPNNCCKRPPGTTPRPLPPGPSNQPDFLQSAFPEDDPSRPHRPSPSFDDGFLTDPFSNFPPKYYNGYNYYKPRPRPQQPGPKFPNKDDSAFLSSNRNYYSFPSGLTVRAHVQSLDILPYGSRIPPPGYALENNLSDHKRK